MSVFAMTYQECYYRALDWLGWDDGTIPQVRIAMESAANFSSSAIYDDWSDMQIIQECLYRLGVK